MTQRDWIEKDFYRELGVDSGASADEIKKAYRKLARELHPDANPGDARAEARFKSVSEAYGVLSDDKKRREYDETRALFAGGAFSGGPGAGGFPGGGFGTGAQSFDLGDLFARSGAAGPGGAGGLGDLFGGLFGNRGGATGARTTANRPQRGADVESELRIDFIDAVRGAEVQIRLSSPGRCDRCGGTGARPGSTPRTCPTCNGVGLVSTSQGAFAFSEPCRDCRGTGRIIDDPCAECGGDGVATRTRTLTVRVPAGVDDGQKIRLAGQGEPGRGGAPAGDLYVKVHVTPHRIFGRSAKNADDLTLKVPVTFPELALGATLTVPTLDGTVSLKVPPGTASGRTLRVRGRGVQRRNGKTGDLLVTVEVAVPARLDDAATEALQAYADATKSFDPRAELLGGR
ncbi:molecular chaperone DnaJ [Pseudonocardia bannensis]|uniref:Chaperone protein DnaJ n=1 Tax=Pseudonocardia bannensis TaxID=630973 RepID=A0A848DIV0_9PSEU|nr:molecular chaperone DnaJ [Pseudonocardia bannensis]NMH92620.1 molecular chaperone DnaJ [Pseudonocardia bannensis]